MSGSNQNDHTELRAGIVTVTDSERALPASLLAVSEGGFRIALPSTVEPGSQIKLRLVDGEHLSGTVHACLEVSSGEFHATIQFPEVASQKERRGEPRFPVRHPAELSVIGVEWNQRLQVMVTNISRSGLAVSMLEPLDIGIAVELRMFRYMVFGVVRRCRRRSSSYEVGITITDTLNVRDEPEKGTSLQGHFREIARQMKLDRHLLLPKFRCWFSGTAAEEAVTPESGCVMGPVKASAWNCEVCQTVERWRLERNTRILCREILGGRGLYLCADSIDTPAAPHFLELRFADLPPADIRRTLQTVLTSTEQTWIALDDRSVRIR